MICDNCGNPDARHETVSDRQLCGTCHRIYVTLGGAATSLSTGGGASEAVGIGLASSGFAGASDAEVEAIRARRRKLAGTEGFWRRFWVRIVG